MDLLAPRRAVPSRRVSVAEALLALAFLATLVAHGVLVVGLARRKQRLRALVAAMVPPLAPYWGWDAGMRLRVAVWWLLVVVYAVGVALLQR